MLPVLRVLSGLGVLAAGTVVANEAFVLLAWRDRRSKLLSDALKAAQGAKKPLLGVDCDCPGIQTVSSKDLPLLPERAFGAVFAEGFDNTRDVDGFLNELYRVADKVFISWFPNDSIFAGSPRNIILSAPPTTEFVLYKDGTTGEQIKVRPSTFEGLR